MDWPTAFVLSVFIIGVSSCTAYTGSTGSGTNIWDVQKAQILANKCTCMQEEKKEENE
jgi:hypothetical protein